MGVLHRALSVRIMSNYIVLVKQVPDVSQITDNAFDPNTGTLIRTRLASVINELDTQALAFANRMRQLSGDKGAKIVALTMGPPMAEEVLRYSLSRCADTVVLLTDRALGGADTVATANPLACSIRKIAKELFNGSEDYFVVSGMQSVDGDTAQVPPQIAEELGISCIAYATDCAFKNGRFEFTRIISGGSQTVAPKRPPVVITVAKYEYPLFASFTATRRANKTKVITWGASEISTATLIGAKGSKTTVIRVFPPGKSSRKCKQLSDARQLAEIIVESVKSSSGAAEADKQTARYVLPAKRKSVLDRSFEGTAKENEDYKILNDKLRELGISDAAGIDEQTKEKIVAAAGEHFHKNALDDMLLGLRAVEPSYKGEVWVVAEHRDGVIHPATFELIGKARDLAGSVETKVGVVIAGHNLQSMAGELIAGGADNVYVIDDPLLAEFDPIAHRKVIADAVSKYWPQIVLYAATPQGRVLAPLISYSVGCGLTADCTGLDIKDSSRKEQIATLFQTETRSWRQRYGDDLHEKLKVANGNRQARRYETIACRRDQKRQRHYSQSQCYKRRYIAGNYQNGDWGGQGQFRRGRNRERRQGDEGQGQLRANAGFALQRYPVAIKCPRGKRGVASGGGAGVCGENSPGGPDGHGGGAEALYRDGDIRRDSAYDWRREYRDNRGD